MNLGRRIGRGLLFYCLVALFLIHLKSVLQKRDWQLTHQRRAFSIPRHSKNEGVRLVSVAHDLSSEIAVAILLRKVETRQLKELKEVVLRVHSVLQKLTTQCREQNRSRHLERRKAV